MRKATAIALVLSAWLICATSAFAHDTWVETNTPIVRQADVLHVDLKLGNHGNDHRDFKLAGKVNPANCKLTVIAPSGAVIDVKDRLVDTGLATKDGYWTARFVPEETGLHLISHTADSLHGTTRSIKSGKTFFAASNSLAIAPAKSTIVSKPQGHALEIVPEFDPVADAAAGQPVRVQVIFEGQPLVQARVSFVPRGVVLAEGFDPEFERMTDDLGRAEFTPKEGNVLLVVVHHHLDDRGGDGFDKTKYSATLTVTIPQIPLFNEVGLGPKSSQK